MVTDLLNRAVGRKIITWDDVCRWDARLSDYTGLPISEETAWEVFEIVHEALSERDLKLFGAVQMGTEHEQVFLVEPTDESDLKEAFVAGHEAGVETASTDTFDIPVESKYENWMAGE